MTHDGRDGSAPEAWQPVHPAGTTAPPPGYPPAPSPGYPPGYPPAPPDRTPAVSQRSPALAVVGLVLACLAPLVGLILSVIAVVRARHDGVGRELAIAGIVVSIVVTPIFAAMVIPVYLNHRAMAEAGPRAAWERVENALADADCDEFMASTTLLLRQQVGATTCARFEVMAAEVVVGSEGVAIVGVEVDGDEAVVTTLELVVLTEGAAPTEERFDYAFVQRDGVWMMTGVDLVE